MSPEPRLAALLSRYALSDRAGEQLAAFAELLSEDPAAATTVRDPHGVLDDHLADALVALELPQIRDATSIADLGSGAGVPGLPLAIALPSARVALVESNGRKCAFIARAASVCGISNAEIVHARAESWDAGRDQHVVTARALAPLPVVVEYAAPLLRIGGALVVWRGQRDDVEEAAGARAASMLGLEPAPPLAVRPYAAARHRHLHVMTKVAPTPSRFPRRPGAARKRPLS